MGEDIHIAKEIQEGNEIMVAQIWMCVTELDKVQQGLLSLSHTLQPVLQQFLSVFEQPSTLPPQRTIDHKIQLLPNYKPVNLRLYRYSYFQKMELEKIVAELLQNTVIRPSTSPFASPALLVKKKDGTWHLCIDYRQLNSQTIKNKYLIPIIEDLPDELHRASYFSKIDLRSGYHQIRMHSEDLAKTVFKTHDGHYEFQVMPFAFTNAPATFQALMNQVFRPLLRRFVLIFFDDILIYNKDLLTHKEHLTLILKKLVEHKLYSKWSKCAFGVTTVEYLGHVITADGVSTDPQKIQAMQQWPEPLTLKELRGFLGLTGYYRKFIKRYGEICKPLTNLLKKNGFHWNEEEKATFEALKSIMCKAQVLVLPNFTQPFIVVGLQMSEPRASWSQLGLSSRTKRAGSSELSMAHPSQNAGSNSARANSSWLVTRIFGSFK
jgi:Reverse transcriptase (RNA-dependent DNA polymerase)